MNPADPNQAFHEFAAAYCRGRLDLPNETTVDEAIDRGLQEGLRLYRFKRNATLPRVRKVLGALRGFGPTKLLDVGSGRGTFLWPLLDELRATEVTVVEADEGRAKELRDVERGGVGRLTALKMDVRALEFEDGFFDGVTILEVLEHLEDPARALREVVRVARRFVIATVPSKEDDNPEHLHVLTKDILEEAFSDAGASKVRFEGVPNHLVAIATT